MTDDTPRGIPTPIPRPRITEAGTANPDAPLHLVCSLPVHYLPEIRTELERLFRVSYCYNRPRDQLLSLLPSADALLVNAAAPYRLDRDLLVRAERLQIIVSPSTGTDHTDLDYCAERGIAFSGLKEHPEVIEQIHGSAEFSFALLMALIRRLPRGVDLARAGYWREVEDELRGIELSGKRLGLVGYGRIGRKMSRYAHAFDARVLAVDPFVFDVDPWVERVESLDALLPVCDIVSLHVHLSDETRLMFNAARFAQMRPGSYFVNTSRGWLVDEPALIAALESGTLAGAAVDVTQGELSGRADENRLVDYARRHDTLIVSPHMAGLTVDAMGKAARQGLRALKAFFQLS